MANSRSILHGEGNCTILTPSLAIKLADAAMKAGRHESAIRYLKIAYALFDAEHHAANSASTPP